MQQLKTTLVACPKGWRMRDHRCPATLYNSSEVSTGAAGKKKGMKICWTGEVLSVEGKHILCSCLNTPQGCTPTTGKNPTAHSFQRTRVNNALWENIVLLQDTSPRGRACPPAGNVQPTPGQGHPRGATLLLRHPSSVTTTTPPCLARARWP